MHIRFHATKMPVAVVAVRVYMHVHVCVCVCICVHMCVQPRACVCMCVFSHGHVCALPTPETVAVYPGHMCVFHTELCYFCCCRVFFTHDVCCDEGHDVYCNQHIQRKSFTAAACIMHHACAPPTKTQARGPTAIHQHCTTQ